MLRRYDLGQLISEIDERTIDPSLSVFDDPATREPAIKFLASFRAERALLEEPRILSFEQQQNDFDAYFELAKSALSSDKCPKETDQKQDFEDLAEAFGQPIPGTIAYLNKRR